MKIKTVCLLIILSCFISMVAQQTNKMDYTEQWNKIHQLKYNDRLPKSALDEIQKLYDTALKEKEYGQVIKAIIYRMDCQAEMKEDTANELIKSLKQDLELVPPPAQAIVYSLLGDVYCKYFQANQWQLMQRSEAAIEDDDVYTWDVNRLYEAALENYSASLKNEALLQKTPLTDYEILLRNYDNKESKAIYSTLYDFLARRTIDMLKSGIGVARPQETFVINQPVFLADARTFSNAKIDSKDTLSIQYQIIHLYQNVLKYKLDRVGKEVVGEMTQTSNQLENARNSFINWDKDRLAYVREQGLIPNADALYETTLLQIRKEFAGYPEKELVDYWLAELYKSQGDKWKTEKNDAYRLKYIQALELCQEIENSSTNGIIKSYAEYLRKAIIGPSVQLTLGKNIYPNTPILALINYRNLPKVEFVFYQVDAKFVYDDERHSIDSTQLNKLKVFRKQILELPAAKDYQRYSAEIKLDELPQGHYIVVARDGSGSILDNEFYSTTLFQVTPISVTLRGHQRNEEVISHFEKHNPYTRLQKDQQVAQIYVMDSKTGEPLPKAKVEIYTKKWNSSRSKYIERLEATYHTDEQGITYFADWNHNDRSYHHSFKRAVVTQADKKLDFSEWYGPFGLYVNDYTYERTVFFTDRSIYRPGQTVYFKALAYESNHQGNNKLLSNKPIFVEFLDVNQKKIQEITLKSNEYGSIQGSFVIPQGLLNGRMTIQSIHGSTSIQVEEYKRPTFEVKFDPVKQNYKLNSEIEVTGSAKALAGYAVDHSQVQYRITRSARYRYARWWLPQISEPVREIASGQMETNAQGIFNIHFKAEADDIKNNDLVYTYTIVADITDVNGETRSATLNLPISNTPLLIQSNIPERIADTGKLTFALSTTNLNGDLTPAHVDIEIIALDAPKRILQKRLWESPDTFTLSKSEFEVFFPFDPYGDENKPSTFREDKKISSLQVETTDEIKNKADANSIQLSVLEKCNPGWYKIRLKARDKTGIETQEDRFVQWLGKSEAEAKPIQQVEDWVTVVKQTGEPGEYAEFMVAGGSANSFVRYEVVCNNRFIEQKTLQVGTTPQKIRIPIQENYRGGFAVQFVTAQNGRLYTSMNEVHVPYTNKMLDITFNTFRDKLLPGEEEKWTITIQNKKGEKEMAELVAGLYDASLDHFRPHAWNANGFYPVHHHSGYAWESGSYQILTTSQYYYFSERTASSYVMPSIYFDKYGSYASYLSTHRYGIYYQKSGLRRNSIVESSADFAAEENSSGAGMVLPAAPPSNAGSVIGALGGEMRPEMAQRTALEDEKLRGKQSPDLEQAPKVSLEGIATRQNFNETAFFYPQLRTDESGKVIIEFTIPEALTRWKMLGFAHTKDFKVGTVSNELITQKQIAISANAPRFFRENDVIEFSAKINNITEDDLAGEALLRLYDAVTMEPIDARVIRSKPNQAFAVKGGESTGLTWTLSIPSDVQAVTYKVTARAGSHTDGEEKVIPVMKNSMLVTETMPFSVRAGQEKTFTFHKLKENKSTTLQNHKLTLEFTSNPAWYAVQALPYLMEYPYECAEQTFARFYANSLAATIANSSPKVKQIFDLWRNVPENKQALLSNLEKNEELKQVMLEETPWVLQAQNETERKKRVGLLFDLNKMAREQRTAFEKIKKAQQGNGGFGWFNGLPPDRYMTQHIIAKIEHLKKLNALGTSYEQETSQMAAKGLSFLDQAIRKDYEDLLKVKDIKMDEQHIYGTQLHYLYTASFSQHKPSNDKQLKAFEYYLGQAEKYWMKFDMYNQALIALALHRYGNKKVPQQILKSLIERSQQSEEMGMYWKDNISGYYWYQAPIETQALLIETFLEVANDLESVEKMKIWLLRMKQTTDWKTTKATSEACYALLMTGGNLLDETKLLEVKVGNKPLEQAIKEPLSSEPGTGYVKTSWNGGDIQPEMGVVNVKNPNSHGIAWGGLYWQYFEQLDKITSAETNLKMNKQLFLQTITNRGVVLEPLGKKHKLKVGDLVKVRMELRADRDFEYVHLKDMRAAGFEPVSTLSGQRYQDGLWYYESIKDASANFFITLLRKGTYVFEYELRVTHAGDFSNGITTFQCMYAPEFSSHSEGIRVKVEGK